MRLNRNWEEFVYKKTILKQFTYHYFISPAWKHGCECRYCKTISGNCNIVVDGSIAAPAIE